MNGKPLPSGTKFLPSIDFGTVRLEIRDCLAKEAGMYKCIATNDIGTSSTSGTLKLLDESSGVSTKSLHPSGASGLQAIVDTEKSTGMKLGDTTEEEPLKQRPVFTTDLPAEVSLAAGQPLVLECQVEPKADPNLQLDWFHNGLPLATGSRIKASSDFGFVSINIADVTERDQGVYTAKATNALGEATTFCSVKLPTPHLGVDLKTLHPRGSEGLQSIGQMEARGSLPDQDEPELTNLRPPRFVTKFNSAVLEEGAVGHFEAKLEPTDDGDITLHWTLDGKPLKESKHDNLIRHLSTKLF